MHSSETSRADKRELITEAAIAVFAQKGFRAARVSDVAQSAGVADGTIYLYFKTKTDVFHQPFVEALTTWSDAVLEKSHGEMTDAEFAEIFWSCAHSDELLLRLLSTPRAWCVPSTADQFVGAHRFNMRILDDVIHLVEDCLDLPKGAGLFLITSLFSLMIGSAQMDMVSLAPALIRESACVAHLPTHRELFLRNAPAIVSASRTFQPASIPVSTPLELVN